MQSDIETQREASDLDEMFHSPAWASVVGMEKRLREEAILNILKLRVDEDGYDRKVAYYAGQAEAITKLWINRDLQRKKKNKGDKK